MKIHGENHTISKDMINASPAKWQRCDGMQHALPAASYNHTSKPKTLTRKKNIKSAIFFMRYFVSFSGSTARYSASKILVIFSILRCYYCNL